MRADSKFGGRPNLFFWRDRGDESLHRLTFTVTAASPDGSLTLDIDGRPVGIGSFASARILVTASGLRGPNTEPSR